MNSSLETAMQIPIGNRRSSDVDPLSATDRLALIRFDNENHDALLRAIKNDDFDIAVQKWRHAWRHCKCGDYVPTYDCPLFLAAAHHRWRIFTYFIENGGQTFRDCGAYYAIASECENRLVDDELFRIVVMLAEQRNSYFLSQHAHDYNRVYAMFLEIALRKDQIKEQLFVDFVLSRFKTTFGFPTVAERRRPWDDLWSALRVSATIDNLSSVKSAIEKLKCVCKKTEYGLVATAPGRLAAVCKKTGSDVQEFAHALKNFVDMSNNRRHRNVMFRYASFQIPLWRRVEMIDFMDCFPDAVARFARALFHAFLLDLVILLYETDICITQPLLESCVEYVVDEKERGLLQRVFSDYNSFFALVPCVVRSCTQLRGSC